MRAHVLIIDESATLRRMLAGALLEDGMTTVQAKDAEEGFAILERGGVDLALVAFHMNKMNGLEFIVHARQFDALKNMPVVLLTSEVSEDIRKRSMDAGARAFIRKPVSTMELMATIRRVLEEA